MAKDSTQGDYVKQYTLRGIGNNVEVWVASDEDEISSGLDFPAGDCRNDGVRNVITDAQVNYLIDQFDNNIYPKESTTFSVPPTADGTKASRCQAPRPPPDDYYRATATRSSR